MMQETLLQVKGLKTGFLTKRGGLITAVDGVDLKIRRGEIVGLVGESGCGKSQTAFAIMGLLRGAARITGGEIWFDDRELTRMPTKERRRLCGSSMAMIFQDPMSSLDPCFTCGRQLMEALAQHESMPASAARERCMKLLAEVGIAAPENCFRSYPHELSGGMCQRVMIAMSLLCNPSLLIADEPTTALDVTVQAQILDLFRKLRQERGMSILIITHDLGVVSELCDRAAVMYGGRIMEEDETHTLITCGSHPYTYALTRAMVTLDQPKTELFSIPGNVPGLSDFPSGCRFSTRCPYADERCNQQPPEMTDCGNGHRLCCYKPGVVKEES